MLSVCSHARSIALALVLGASLLTGCLEQSKNITTLSAQSCNPTGARTSSARLARALASPASARNKEACGRIESYICTRKVFSPDVTDGRGRIQECAGSEGLGDVCTEIEIFSFSTKEASAFANLPPAETEPGGSLNYEEYLCATTARRPGSGSARTLATALDHAYSSCLEGQ